MPPGQCPKGISFRKIELLFLAWIQALYFALFFNQAMFF